MTSSFILKSFYNITGGISIGNGIWMLLSASTWFTQMPVGAENTGPLNSHFVHDVGLVYILVGIGAFWCASRLEKALATHLAMTAFMAGHALIHVGEILTGALPPVHWLIDFPLVTFPALALVALTPVLLKRKKLTA